MLKTAGILCAAILAAAAFSGAADARNGARRWRWRCAWAAAVDLAARASAAPVSAARAWVAHKGGVAGHGRPCWRRIYGWCAYCRSTRRRALYGRRRVAGARVGGPYMGGARIAGAGAGGRWAGGKWAWAAATGRAAGGTAAAGTDAIGPMRRWVSASAWRLGRITAAAI